MNELREILLFLKLQSVNYSVIIWVPMPSQASCQESHRRSSWCLRMFSILEKLGCVTVVPQDSTLARQCDRNNLQVSSHINKGFALFSEERCVALILHACAHRWWIQYVFYIRALIADEPSTYSTYVRSSLMNPVHILHTCAHRWWIQYVFYIRAPIADVSSTYSTYVRSSLKNSHLSS